MSGWIRAKSDEKAVTRIVSSYKLPTTEYAEIERLLQETKWGQGNTVTLAAMKIGARVLLGLIDHGLSLEEAVAKADAMMQNRPDASGGKAAGSTAAPGPVEPPQRGARDGFSSSSQRMFEDER